MGNTSEREEDDLDNFMDAGGSEPKAKEDICSWEELQEQLKSDLLEGYKKNERPTHVNKLTIIRNFATLCIKGVRCIAASKEIAQQFHDVLTEPGCTRWARYRRAPGLSSGLREAA